MFVEAGSGGAPAATEAREGGNPTNKCRFIYTYIYIHMYIYILICRYTSEGLRNRISRFKLRDARTGYVERDVSQQVVLLV